MDACIDTDMLVWFRLLILAQESNRGQEFTGRVLSVYSVLNRVTIDLDIVLFVLQFVAS